MKKYIVRHTVMISEKQSKSLSILKEHNVNVSNFTRIAIREKIKRDWKSIKQKTPKTKTPF